MSPGYGSVRGVVGREGWSVTLPDGPLTLLQIGIGIIDLCFCALAMYMLVPDEPNIGFVTLAVDLRRRHAARLRQPRAGRASGVFDAAMLVALWQFDKEDLLAGLLLFRLLYYIVPFVLSLFILGGRELMLALRGTPPPPIPALPSLAPTDVSSPTAPARERAQRGRLTNTPAFWLPVDRIGSSCGWNLCAGSCVGGARGI